MSRPSIGLEVYNNKKTLLFLGDNFRGRKPYPFLRTRASIESLVSAGCEA